MLKLNNLFEGIISENKSNTGQTQNNLTVPYTNLFDITDGCTNDFLDTWLDAEGFPDKNLFLEVSFVGSIYLDLEHIYNWIKTNNNNPQINSLNEQFIKAADSFTKNYASNLENNYKNLLIKIINEDEIGCHKNMGINVIFDIIDKINNKIGPLYSANNNVRFYGNAAAILNNIYTIINQNQQQGQQQVQQGQQQVQQGQQNLVDYDLLLSSFMKNKGYDDLGAKLVDIYLEEPGMLEGTDETEEENLMLNDSKTLLNYFDDILIKIEPFKNTSPSLYTYLFNKINSLKVFANASYPSFLVNKVLTHDYEEGETFNPDI